MVICPFDVTVAISGFSSVLMCKEFLRNFVTLALEDCHASYHFQTYLVP